MMLIGAGTIMPLTRSILVYHCIYRSCCSSVSRACSTGIAHMVTRNRQVVHRAMAGGLFLKPHGNIFCKFMTYIERGQLARKTDQQQSSSTVQPSPPLSPSTGCHWTLSLLLATVLIYLLNDDVDLDVSASNSSTDFRSHLSSPTKFQQLKVDVIQLCSIQRADLKYCKQLK